MTRMILLLLALALLATSSHAAQRKKLIEGRGNG